MHSRGWLFIRRAYRTVDLHIICLGSSGLELFKSSAVQVKRYSGRALSGVIYTRGGITAVTGPVSMEELAALAVYALIGMCAEVVALSLE